MRALTDENSVLRDEVNRLSESIREASDTNQVRPYHRRLPCQYSSHRNYPINIHCITITYSITITHSSAIAHTTSPIILISSSQCTTGTPIPPYLQEQAEQLANVESERDQLSGQLEDCLTLAESAHDLRMQLEKAGEDAEATEVATSLRIASAQKEIDR